MTFADVELMRLESIKDKRFLTKDRKSGDSFADSL